ncbi:MAG: carboxypeptidase regulatory-like domain-containing protein [Clostridiales bacterium]|nr:carboxypeptidase regulatory-like domain-containing protein [Clostridiales bacterium]
MKCPNCGKWNQATMPRCIYCGEELPDDAYGMSGVPAWQLELQDREKAKSYIHVDEYGQMETSEDPRDSLAAEMADLKSRKLMGEEKQRLLREEAARRGMAPSGLSVRTTSNRGTFFSAYDDNPDATLRPVAPELIEDGELDPNARRVYPAKYRTTHSSGSEDEVYGYGNTRRLVNVQKPDEDDPVYDGYHDTSAYLPAHSNPDEIENSMRMRMRGTIPTHKPRKPSGRRIFNAFLIIACIAMFSYIAVTAIIPAIFPKAEEVKAVATVTPTIRDDLAAHTITVPGEDGQRITIRELRTSAIVTGGFATFDVMDHIWYDDYENYVEETMTVTLTPLLITDAGKQQALDQINYDIDIPLSPIELVTPDGPYQVVSTAMYNIIINVREGSTVLINGDDYSDLVNTEGGKVNYNATVQPIGENNFEIVVRSQYCRENSMTVTLFREKQEIPLDLASDIASSSSDKSATMTVKATTIPGAVVKVLSPYTDLDITSTGSDGTFSFKAVFDKIGDNSIIITADYPGKQTTTVEHVVYYVPNIDIYSRKAWSISEQYTDLMDNLETRKSKSQIYVCIGEITSIETTKPQRAFMNVGTLESPLVIYVENSSKTTWIEGQKYRLYGDAYGMYSSKPWIVVRYTYD